MDASELDYDIKLQKISGDFISQFDSALPDFLRKTDGRGARRIRSHVRFRELFHLTSTLLDPFQELPQLLDPHLPKWIPFLSQAFLEHLQTRSRARRPASERSKLLVPVDYAIAKILYSFCKIRGEKVIVRFLNVETKYLEPLLTALEDSGQQQQHDQGQDHEGRAPRSWSWEQRYIVLLWLSHLLLAPFDLSTISTVEAEDVEKPVISGLDWPEHLPGITLRVVPLAIRYLSSAGKERDASKELLVRIAMRRDMQKLGLLDALIFWSIHALRKDADALSDGPYFYLGILSFLARALQASSDTSDMERHLAPVFHAIHGISADENNRRGSVASFALARKLILKIMRSIVVAILRKGDQDVAGTDMIETSIGYLLESLADNDTPVRLAASKSLSVITLKLDPEMAAEVVDAVLGSLNCNILWTKAPGSEKEKAIRDVSAVNALEWHGLMLTLSHLLYRRSPPAEQLSDIVHALLLGLSFEQRSTSGGSVGSNVRDAACFGIWAVARRYTTRELLAVPTTSVFAARAHPSANSVIQILATELVTAACLDPAGNIRRGSSAALQELIGRHPDTVDQGIWVVQKVDYHAVARRSRALDEVAIGAARLSSQYGIAIVEGILGWRGVGDVDAQSRRNVALAFGELTALLAQSGTYQPLHRIQAFLQRVRRHVESLQPRQVEERHGLLLCYSTVVDKMPHLAAEAESTDSDEASTALHEIIHFATSVLVDCKSTTFRRPELIAEASSRLVVSTIPVLQANLCDLPLSSGLETMFQLLLPSRRDACEKLVSNLDRGREPNPAVDAFMSTLQEAIPLWLSRSEAETIEPVSQAALTLLMFCSSSDRAGMLKGWCDLVRQKASGRASNFGNNYLYAIVLAQPLVEGLAGGEGKNGTVYKALLERWESDKEIEIRVAILQSLTGSRLLSDQPLLWLDLLSEGLNDYTTNARGDMGSHVRVQALKAVQSLWKDLAAEKADGGSAGWVHTSVKTLFHDVLRLSAEKLDRVRPEAQAALAFTLETSHAEQLRLSTFSSKAYFRTLLNLLSSKTWFQPHIYDTITANPDLWMSQLMAGYVTSADTGNEDLVIDSRTALCEFCETLDTGRRNLDLICAALHRNLKTFQGRDRIVIPTLEVIAFLFHVGLFQQCCAGGGAVDTKDLCLQTQKAGYKTGNVRKIEACIKVYGGIAGLSRIADKGPETKPACASDPGLGEARKRLAALMFHPWPRVRSLVVDELWGLLDETTTTATNKTMKNDRLGGRLLGTDWARASKGEIKTVVEELGLQ